MNQQSLFAAQCPYCEGTGWLDAEPAHMTRADQRTGAGRIVCTITPLGRAALRSARLRAG